MGASRTQASAIGAHIRALDYQIKIMESRMNATGHKVTIDKRETEIKLYNCNSSIDMWNLK